MSGSKPKQPRDFCFLCARSHGEAGCPLTAEQREARILMRIAVAPHVEPWRRR